MEANEWPEEGREVCPEVSATTSSGAGCTKGEGEEKKEEKEQTNKKKEEGF